MDNWQLQTPVAFLVFNRPDTTEQVFKAIAQTRPPQLLVVADGPRPNRPGEAEKCAAVRRIIERVDWPCEVLTNYAETNLGCGRRVSSGLDWVFETVEEAIILEDDCLPHPTFFRFCQELLERFRDDERVMMITGTNYLLQLDIPASYLFSRYFSVWGWATWRRAWQTYNFNMAGWEKLKAQQQVKYFYPQAYMVKYVSNMFDAVYNHQIDTWDVQWFYCCLFNNGLSAVPRVNLISNIGVVGTHTSEGGEDLPLPTFALEVDRLVHPKQVFADRLYDHRMFEARIKTPFWIFYKRRAIAARRKIIRLLRNGLTPAVKG
ncbi:MAG: glycosyltransferase family A protein [Chloroflexota bacterium]